MKVILVRKVEKLGDTGDVVNVKDGYAVNYLIPSGMAVIGTDEKIAIAKKKFIQKKKKEKDVEKKIESVSQSFRNKKFKMSVKTSSGGRTFAAIGREQVEDLISKSINKKGDGIIVEVDLPQPIKEVGKYSLDVVFSSPGKRSTPDKEKTEIILEVVSK